jgi:broad specificity phosphatase PhoE
VEAEARILDEIEQIAARHPRGRVVVGTHGDLVRVMISHYTGAHLDQFQRVMVDPASVSVVHLGDGVPRILLMNDTGSLHRFAPDRRERGVTASGRPRGDGRKRKLRG